MAKLPIPFNNPATYPGHSGVDYGQPRGKPFAASGPGVVRTRSQNDAGGFYIWVQYDAGPLVGYHHMDSHNGCPAVGARVQEGTRLGYVGSLGRRSTGPHLHSECACHRTTAGYWTHFDSTRVIGTGSTAGGSTPLPKPPTPAPAPIPEEETDMAKLIRNTDGTIFQLDEFGVVDPRSLLDPGAGLTETVNAMDSAYGAEQLSDREFDLVGMAARNRWDQVRAQIVADVVAALKEVLPPKA